MVIFFGTSALMTLITPIAVIVGDYELLIAVRVLTGIGSGATIPCAIGLCSQWAPPNERARLTNIIMAGCWMGNVFTLPVSGYITSKHGWPVVFYTIGLLSFAWLFLWCIFVSNTPAKHKYIS